MDKNNKNYIKSQIRQNINKTKHNQEKSEANSEVEYPKSKNQQTTKQQNNNDQNQSIDEKSRASKAEDDAYTESNSEELNPDNKTTDQFLVILESFLLFLLITIPGLSIFGLKHIFIFFVYLVLGFIAPVGYYSYKKLFPKENNIFGRTVIIISVFLLVSVTIFLNF